MSGKSWRKICQVSFCHVYFMFCNKNEFCDYNRSLHYFCINLCLYYFQSYLENHTFFFRSCCVCVSVRSRVSLLVCWYGMGVFWQVDMGRDARAKFPKVCDLQLLRSMIEGYTHTYKHEYICSSVVPTLFCP